MCLNICASLDQWSILRTQIDSFQPVSPFWLPFHFKTNIQMKTVAQKELAISLSIHLSRFHRWVCVEKRRRRGAPYFSTTTFSDFPSEQKKIYIIYKDEDKIYNSTMFPNPERNCQLFQIGDEYTEFWTSSALQTTKYVRPFGEKRNKSGKDFLHA